MSRLRQALWLVPLLLASALAQRERGQLLLEVFDSTGARVAASAELLSQVNQFQRNFFMNSQGPHIARDLPFGIYQLTVSRASFANATQLIEIRSEVPVHCSITLQVATVATQVEVNTSATLLNPYRNTTIFSLGKHTISEQLSVSPGRALSDVVNTQPGWLYEANGILHPRGSEYDVQFVVDGLPRMENRSPAFAPPFDDEDMESVQVRTSGYPAEYGRKLGGVVEVATDSDVPSGWHGQAVANGGSFDTANGYLGFSYVPGANQFFLSLSGGLTNRYLDPPVISNYTNHASLNGFSFAYARQLTSQDHLRLAVEHNAVGFQVPNELVQQEAGQRQDRRNEGTSGEVYYLHVLSPNALLSVAGSVRDSQASLHSNDFSTPVIAGQQRGFREAYARADIAVQSGHHHWKVGMDGLHNAVHEGLQYSITDPSQFDPDVQPNFSFTDHRNDRELSVFAQDQVHLGNWNLSLGMRFDHYSFLVSESAWSPRLAVSRFFSGPGLLVHFSYDRIFQTPAMENLLLASSPQVDQLSAAVLRVPVPPAHANFFELGATKSIFGKASLTANIFRRNFRDYADDDVLLNTGVSFPISFSQAQIQGIESKLEVQGWKRFSGFLSYANQRGTGQGPITGGLFLGADAQDALEDRSRFPVSQDQRNTAHARIRYQMLPRVWLASSASYGSGLPVEAEGGDFDYDFLLSQYGPEVLSHVNFKRERVRPSFSMDIAGGVDLYHRERNAVALQMQLSNLTNRLNVINFASLFSGTALAPGRSVSAQLKFEF